MSAITNKKGEDVGDHTEGSCGKSGLKNALYPLKLALLYYSPLGIKQMFKFKDCIQASLFHPRLGGLCGTGYPSAAGPGATGGEVPVCRGFVGICQPSVALQYNWDSRAFLEQKVLILGECK